MSISVDYHNYVPVWPYAQPYQPYVSGIASTTWPPAPSFTRKMDGSVWARVWALDESTRAYAWFDVCVKAPDRMPEATGGE